MSICVTDPAGTEWVARTRPELVRYLNRTAAPDYAARVLAWYDTDTGIPFEIANGDSIDIWDIGLMPKPDVPASTFKGKRRG